MGVQHIDAEALNRIAQEVRFRMTKKFGSFKVIVFFSTNLELLRSFIELSWIVVREEIEKQEKKQSND